MKRSRLVSLLVFTIPALLLSSCATLHYRRVSTGELKGKIIVRVLGFDEFIFLPHRDDPLTFTRRSGDKLSPDRAMYTDGGSIPRALWAFRNYSPWGYAHAFMIHDWLFEMKHCQLPGHERYTAEEAAWVMSEVMKTMMEHEGMEAVEKFTLYSMFEAVRSPIAAELWEHGTCNPPPPELAARRAAVEYVVEFPTPPKPKRTP